ncbi:A-type_flavoprotein [Hexamita inflata]|uniref:A-type_flavoprotein n=1 Tax=Hexamita inflata TaxID=28002 RepID=A0ABP1KZ70_9EUKA
MPLAHIECVGPDVYWVGTIDWSVRVFHGYHTDEGSSYNSYLLMDDDITLIDTVHVRFATEFLERVAQVTPLSSIKYLVMNHAENDHSSALPATLAALPNVTLVTNKTCYEHLSLLYPVIKSYPHIIITSSTPLKLKTHTLVFVPVPLLHWPDSMFTYCPESKILFSNDGFGQHIACSERFTDQFKSIDHIIKLMREYNANILGPFQQQLGIALQVAGTIQIEYILTAHGLSWRGGDMGRALTEYANFASNKQITKKMTIIYPVNQRIGQKHSPNNRQRIQHTSATNRLRQNGPDKMRTARVRLGIPSYRIAHDSRTNHTTS